MATTALQPFDPAASPRQISRVLSIRANLLPPEITARRNVRRMRVIVIVALVLVAALLGAWYAHARSEMSQATRELDAVNAQTAQVRNSQSSGQNSKAAAVKKENETITSQLTALMAQDLSWAALTDEISATGTEAGVAISAITGSLTDAATVSSTLPSTTSASSIVILQITGTGADKKTIAGFVEALGKLTDVASPYLTSATQGDDGMTFTLSAEVTSAASCGRFTTTCKSGGK